MNTYMYMYIHRVDIGHVSANTHTHTHTHTHTQTHGAEHVRRQAWRQCLSKVQRTLYVYVYVYTYTPLYVVAMPQQGNKAPPLLEFVSCAACPARYTYTFMYTHVYAHIRGSNASP